MKALELKQQFAQLKTNVIEAIKLIINAQDIEIYSSEDLEEGDYDVDDITLINDFCKTDLVTLVGCKNGRLLFYDADNDSYEGEVRGLAEVGSLDDLLRILELLERNSAPIESEKNYDFKIGDTVIVADPKPRDLWNHSFMGEITGIFESLKYCVVTDGEGDFWDVDFDQLEKHED